MLILSSSRISSFFPCPMRHHYAYVERLTPKVEAFELRFGRMLHAGLAGYYSHGRSLNKALISMEAEYGKQLDGMLANDNQIWDEDRERWAEANLLASGMLTHYADWDSRQEPYGSERPLGIEHSFEVPISGDAVFRGVIDLMTESDDELYIWDHKTVSAFSSTWESQNHLDRQFRRYAWAVRELTGKAPNAFIVNGLRKKLPTVPQMLKKGGLSQRKDIDTTVEVYLEAIRANDMRPDDYADTIEMLEAKGNTFFRRDVIYFNHEEIDEAGRELERIAEYMSVNGGEPFKVSSPLCTRLRPCPYRSLCVEDTPEARMMFKSRGGGEDENN